MEEDGGAPETYLDIGRAILKNSPSNNKIVATTKIIIEALFGIASVLKVKDTDDWIGSIQYHVSRDNGEITSTSFGVYNPNDNSNGTNEKLNNTIGHNFLLAGDGSHYILRTEIR